MLESFWNKPCPQGIEVYTCSSFIKIFISDIKKFLCRLWAKGYSIRVFSKMTITTLLPKNKLTANSCIFTSSVRSKQQFHNIEALRFHDIEAFSVLQKLFCNETVTHLWLKILSEKFQLVQLWVNLTKIRRFFTCIFQSFYTLSLRNSYFTEQHSMAAFNNILEEIMMCPFLRKKSNSPRSRDCVTSCNR